MRYFAAICLLLSMLLLAACSTGAATPTEAVSTVPASSPVVETTLPPEPATVPTTPETTEATLAEPVVMLTEEEKTMLLKIGMAELGGDECTECIALVMCTVLNRVDAKGFGSSVRSVLMAPEQFTPVSDGSYASAEPNQRCYDALEMVIHGWDESQGALYYEFCEGESWHSKNLNLLFQHCRTRFYN